MAEHINKTDTLNEGRVKLNAAISDSNIAKDKAEQADVKSTQALANSESTQIQLDTIVIEGDSSVEAAQARVDELGEGHATLKARIDDGFEKTSSQLADIVHNVKNFGLTIEDGIKQALEYVEPITILIPSGEYIINSPITASLISNKIITTSGRVVIKYVGEENEHVISVNQRGNNLEILGDLTLDLSEQARQGLVVRNITETMNDASDFIASNLTVMGGLSRTEGKACDGIEIRGGYNLVKLDRCTVVDMDRLEGVGVPHSQGTCGINITHSGLSAYPKQVVINQPTVKRITSQEPEGSNNLDCDGIKSFAPPSSSNGGTPLESILIIDGAVFEDCRGRSIKSQMATNTIKSPTFIRKNITSIPNGVEIDLQRGLGVIDDIKIRYSMGDDGTHPLGSSFRVVNATAMGKGFVTVGKVEAYFDLPDTSKVPYFMTFSGGDDNVFSYIGINSITMFGRGAFDSILRGTFSSVDSYSVENTVIRRLIKTLVDNTTSYTPQTYGSINNNRHLDPRKVPLEITSGDGTIKTGTGNIGFERSLRSGHSSDTESLRVDKVMAKEGTSGALAFETEVISPGATHNFNSRGTANNIGIYFLVINQATNNAIDILSVAGTTIRPLSNAGGSTVVEYGSGTNPGVDSKFNVWFTNSGCHIENRTATNRTVSLISIG